MFKEEGICKYKRRRETKERSMMTPPRIFAILDLVIQSESKVREIWELYT